MEIHSNQHYNELADDAVKDSEKFLALAKKQAPDNVYREGTPEYENLTESFISLGIAIGLRFAAMPPAEG